MPPRPAEPTMQAFVHYLMHRSLPARCALTTMTYTKKEQYCTQASYPHRTINVPSMDPERVHSNRCSTSTTVHNNNEVSHPDQNACLVVKASQARKTERPPCSEPPSIAKALHVHRKNSEVQSICLARKWQLDMGHRGLRFDPKWLDVETRNET